MEGKGVLVVFTVIIVISSIIIGAVVTLATSAKKPTGGGTSGSVNVEILNYAFHPQNITITQGTTVEWYNNDTVAHTVTSLAGAPAAFDSGVINPGSTFTYTFTVSGAYSYYCKIHPFMRGNVTAGGSNATAVSIKNYAFNAQNVTIKAGTTVIWTNDDTVAHTVTTLAGAPVAFDSGVLNPGTTFSYTFTQTGTYPYYCMIHPFMKGNVTVTP